ncbi:MAG: FkbM family methyltransferase [Candidatus Hydrogenedentes bacterium]|nr:FkbM family methyltransferase [Candidatus Hydrogenedentota bacterium]
MLCCCAPAAVGLQDGTAPFYAIKNIADLPEAVRGLGSFSRDVILAHKVVIPNIESLMERITVPTITIMGLLQKYSVERLDLLQLDTEGYDFELLKMLDFKAVKPAIIHFEHVHLSSVDWSAACNLLASNEYRLAQVGPDTIAYRQFRRLGG